VPDGDEFNVHQGVPEGNMGVRAVITPGSPV
jgi:hypothetical protein